MRVIWPSVVVNLVVKNAQLNGQKFASSISLYNQIKFQQIFNLDI